MPVIRVSDSLFGRLQAIATPFVDTPASVIERLLDLYDSRTGQGRQSPPEVRSNHGFVIVVKDFSPYDAPDLRHTRIVQAEIAGQTASHWNELVHLAHRQAVAKVKDMDALRSSTLSNIVPGRKSDSGFHYLSDINVSVQNVEANTAWKNALHLAKRFNLEISVQFEWPDRDGAAMPGKRGRLAWSPNRKTIIAE